MRLYVGNLPFNITETDLQDTFEPFGTVTDVKIVMDQTSGRSRGFGFVTMGTDAEGAAAIAGLEGKNLEGRNLTVNEARPREDRPNGRSSYGGHSKRPLSGSRRY
jgi:cold-inducible RNA-binding protein